MATTLIGFESLTAYEANRKKLMEDPEAKENLAHAQKSGCILIEDRSWFYRIGLPLRGGLLDRGIISENRCSNFVERERTRGSSPAELPIVMLSSGN